MRTIVVGTTALLLLTAPANAQVPHLALWLNETCPAVVPGCKGKPNKMEVLATDVAVTLPAKALSVHLTTELGALQYHNRAIIRRRGSANLAAQPGQRSALVAQVSAVSALLDTDDGPRNYHCKEQPDTRSAFDVVFQCWVREGGGVAMRGHRERPPAGFVSSDIVPRR